MRSFILTVVLITVASAAPFVIPPLDDHFEGSTYLIPASDDQRRIPFSDHELVPSDEPEAEDEPTSTTTPDGSEDGGGSGDDDPLEPDGPDGTIFGDANAAALELGDFEEGSACFPGSAQVHLEDGTVKVMAELEIGDRVMITPNVFSEVFMFTHKLDEGDYTFIRLVTDSGKALSVTAGHFIYINGRPVTAENAYVGDFVELADGRRTAIISISSVRDRGLFNPQTRHGDVMVNGIRASTYTAAVEPYVAHALLAPFRALFAQFSFHTTSFDGGADSFIRMFPKGKAVF